MKRYIVIEYNPDKVVEDQKGYDLYEQVCDTFDDAGISAQVVEFIGKPDREDLGNYFGGKWS